MRIVLVSGPGARGRVGTALRESKIWCKRLAGIVACLIACAVDDKSQTVVGMHCTARRREGGAQGVNTVPKRRTAWWRNCASVLWLVRAVVQVPYTALKAEPQAGTYRATLLSFR
jgi:hypothetical protein